MKNIFFQYFLLPPLAIGSWRIAEWKARCQQQYSLRPGVRNQDGMLRAAKPSNHVQRSSLNSAVEEGGHFARLVTSHAAYCHFWDFIAWRGSASLYRYFLWGPLTVLRICIKYMFHIPRRTFLLHGMPLQAQCLGICESHCDFNSNSLTFVPC